jgi:hypothetical protein
MLYLNWRKKVNGPYPFFRVHNQSAATTILWIVVLFAAVAAISTAVWLISRSHFFVGNFARPAKTGLTNGIGRCTIPFVKARASLSGFTRRRSFFFSGRKKANRMEYAGEEGYDALQGVE